MYMYQANCIYLWYIVARSLNCLSIDLLCKFMCVSRVLTYSLRSASGLKFFKSVWTECPRITSLLNSCYSTDCLEHHSSECMSDKGTFICVAYCLQLAFYCMLIILLFLQVQLFRIILPAYKQLFLFIIILFFCFIFYFFL